MLQCIWVNQCPSFHLYNQCHCCARLIHSRTLPLKAGMDIAHCYIHFPCHGVCQTALICRVYEPDLKKPWIPALYLRCSWVHREGQPQPFSCQNCSCQGQGWHKSKHLLGVTTIQYQSNCVNMQHPALKLCTSTFSLWLIQFPLDDHKLFSAGKEFKYSWLSQKFIRVHEQNFMEHMKSPTAPHVCQASYYKSPCSIYLCVAPALQRGREEK